MKKDLILKKIAWSFNHTTGIEYEELHSEATLAYYEALQKIEDTPTGLINPFIFRCVQNHLIDFCKNIKKYKKIQNCYPPNDSGNYIIDYFQPADEKFELQEFSIISQDLITFIFKELNVDFSLPAKMIRGELFRGLRESGWKWNNIWQGFRELKEVYK